MKQFLLCILSLYFSLNIFSQVPPPPLFSGETYTTMYSASYDYQGNGSLNYLLQDPANPSYQFAIMMGVRDSGNPSPFSQRYTYTAITDNGGLNWFSDRLSTVRSGFPQCALIRGTTFVVHHEGTPNTVKVFEDVVFGAFSFTQYTPPALLPNGTWAGITGNSIGPQITVIAAVNNTGGPFPISKINSTNAGNSWTSWTTIPNITGPSGSHSIFSGTNGYTGIAGFNYDSLQINMANGTMYYYQSTNHGLTFDSVKIFFKPYYSGDFDTIYHDIDAGLNGIFSNNEPHIVFGIYGNTAVQVGNSLAFRYCRIVHWSPSTGLTTVSDNINTPAITDTVNNILIAPRCQPVIGRLANGTLVCAFTGLTRGHTQVVGNGETFNTGDIYVSYSSNNGVNWSQPGNFTNTAGIEEKQPSIVPQSTDNIARIIYFRDMRAGYYALDTTLGKAPYYCIMKKTDLTGINAAVEIPSSFSLGQNYPNPFNPVTNIEFTIPVGDSYMRPVQLIIYDVIGRKIETLVNSELAPGTYKVDWNAANYPSGVYFYRLTADGFTETRKMMLIK